MSVRVQSEQTFLRVIANATPVTHNILGAIPNKGTFPLPNTKTGTITSTPGSTGTDNKRAVVGTGTLFRTEVFVGDYIYAGDVLRMVTEISTDTLLFVRNPFPSTVTAAELKICRAGKYKIVQVKNTGPVDGVYNEAKIEAADVVLRANDMGLAPVSYDVSASTAELTFDLSE